jgi:hypothetical protein
VVVQLAHEVNEAIAEIGRRFEVGDVGLDFFCECGAEACLERLSLTISAFDGFRSTSEPLLVDGHPLVRAADARAHAVTLKDSASALRAQSAQQLARARRHRPRTAGHDSIPG